MIRVVQDIVVAIALVPIAVTLVMGARHVWALRASGERRDLWPIGKPAMVFGAALAVNGLWLFAFISPVSRLLSASGYAAAVMEEAGHGEIKRAAELAGIALDQYPDSGELSALATSAMLRASDCEGLRGHLTRNPAALASADSHHRNLLTLARVARVCDVPLKENPGAARLIDSLRNRAGRSEAHDLLLMGMGLSPGMGAGFRQYVRAPPAAVSVRDDTVIEGVTTQTGEEGRHQFIVYFRPLSDWQGRRLWVHAYPAGSREYVDVVADFPAFPAWRKDELAWEVFQTPDRRAFNIYVGVAIGDDLGPAVPIGLIGGR